MSELELLRELGEQLVPPPLQSLRETARRRTRRAAALSAVTATVAATVLTFTTLHVLIEKDAAPAPANPVDDVRPLTYADGVTIHLGDVEVTAPGTVLELDVTDAGALARLEDGGIWFTDGDALEQIGTIGGPAPEFTGDRAPDANEDRIVSGNLGALAAWFEFSEPSAPMLVVYDTAARAVVVDHAPVTVTGVSSEAVASVTDRSVYWYLDTVDGVAETPGARFDLASATQSAITEQEYVADLPAKGSRRTLTVNNDGTWPTEVIDGIGQQMGQQAGFESGSFTPVGGGDFREWNGLTHEPFVFDALRGYQNALMFLVQWVDDDTVVLRALFENRTDLIVCHNSTSTCEVAATGPPSLVVPG